MSSKKSKFAFLKTKEFKVFLTIWVVYIFYLQMFGSSCMANSQSSLTAAIVNEGKFEIDTYQKISCDIAFYKGHYYSGQAPGISFISVPIYMLSKPIFYILPQNLIDSSFKKLEKYGYKLPADYWGNKKVLSNYFVGLNKRQILEYIFISGFILPIFTTALFGAITALLLYMFLKRFTKNEKLRLVTTFLYAFGTILFPLSTEFFERPIAITLAFAAFFILFKIRNKELKPKGSTIFASGILIGISAWFDYFHLFVSGLLFLYLLSFCIKFNKPRTFNLNKPTIFLLLKFIAGVLIPALLLFSYFYIIFDNPLANSYTHRTVSTSDASISGLLNIKPPSTHTLVSMLEFFTYSPIILIALYGVFKAILARDRYGHDAWYIAIFGIFVFIYATLLTLAYPDAIASSFKRHMTAIFPYTMLLLPYAILDDNKKTISKKIIKILVVVSIISVFFNWTAAQYGGHHALTQYNIDENRFITGVDFFQNGPSSDLLTTLAGVLIINSLLLNIIGLVILVLLIYLIWKPYLTKSK
jgi:hypothetical protein